MIPCCCCLPYLDTYDGKGKMVSTSRYICDWCLFVSKYSINSPNGDTWYTVRPDTCVFDCCVKCNCDGKGSKCFRVPFYIRDPVTLEKVDDGEAKFVDLWAGWTAECCTKRDLYELKFLSQASSQQKIAIVGCAHLVDITTYEQRNAH